jgi:hypothetical protein
MQRCTLHEKTALGRLQMGEARPVNAGNSSGTYGQHALEKAAAAVRSLKLFLHFSTFLRFDI